MIIKFREILEAYLTPGERARVGELRGAITKLDITTREEHPLEFERMKEDYPYIEGQEEPELPEWKAQFWEKRLPLEEEYNYLQTEAKRRYKKAKGVEGILEDVRRIVEAYEKEDYLQHLRHIKEVLSLRKYTLAQIGITEEERKVIITYLEDRALENFNNCYMTLWEYLEDALKLLDEDPETKKEALEIIRARVALWYERPIEGVLGERTTPSSNLPILHGRATDAIAKMVGKSSLLSVDQITHTGTYSTGKGEKEVIGILRQFDTLAGALGVSTHKLLMAGVAVFTDRNHTGESTRVIKDTSVAIPLKVYASKCGYDVEIHKKNTPEEAKKEAERAKSALKNARRKISKDLELLYNFSLKYKDNVRGKLTDFGERRLIDSYDIKGGYIHFNFAKEFSEYLILLPLNQYPEVLLSLDERNSNAYNIGLQLSYHFNNDNNIGKGTAQLLKVKTLLSYTDLPSIDVVRAQNKSWVERIKEPLEASLDALGGDYTAETYDKKTKKKISIKRKGCGYLKDWEYTHAKGEPLTDEEAEALINDYERWADTLVKFTPIFVVDHTARLEAKAQRIAEAEEKKKKKISKKRNKDKS